MRYLKYILTLLVLLNSFALPVHGQECEVFSALNRTIELNDDWKFALTEEDAYATDFDDQSWRTLDVPHDWSIEQDFTAEAEAESGFLTGGVGWYRKHFQIDETFTDKRVFVNFGGVYMNAEVYINGRKLGDHPYGYTSFSFELTDDLKLNEDNVLAVRVNNLQPNSRWYSGSGIERGVTLTVTEQTLIEENGVVVTTPNLEKSQGKDGRTVVSVMLESTQKDEVDVLVRLVDPYGNTAAETDAKSCVIDQEVQVGYEMELDEPELWSINHGVQYKAVAEVYRNGQLIDSASVPYGYRYYSFDRDHGFSLNGEPMKLKGVCLHQDQGALGCVENRSAFSRQLDLMIAMGANAVRITHHPASSVLMELCAEKGLLVIEEAFDTWSNAKNYNWNDYGWIYNTVIDEDNEIRYAEPGMTWAEMDIKTMVRCERNNPAVILWSIGNEILGNIGDDTELYPQYAKELCTWVNEMDGTRPVTIADNFIHYDRTIQDQMDQAVADAGGIIGLNYAVDEMYDEMRELHPDWTYYGSETASTYTSRDTYYTYGIDEKQYQVTSYDKMSVEWGSTAEQAWKDVITRDYVAGEFVWTGFDYLGEPEPWNGLEAGSVTGSEPLPRSSYFGLVDTAGIPKDIYYFYQSMWNEDVTTLHLLPSWDSGNIKKNLLGQTEVVVYSNAASVELFRNGRSMGRKYAQVNTTEDGYTWQSIDGHLYYSWKIRYKDGTLSAVAYDADGNVIDSTVGRDTVSTASEPVSISLIPEQLMIKADGQDLCYIQVELYDEDGNIVTDQDIEFRCEISGEGTIAGIDNGDPTDITPFGSMSRKTFRGKAVVIVKSTKEAGSFTLKVDSGQMHGYVTIPTIGE